MTSLALEEPHSESECAHTFSVIPTQAAEFYLKKFGSWICHVIYSFFFGTYTPSPEVYVRAIVNPYPCGRIEVKWYMPYLGVGCICNCQERSQKLCIPTAATPKYLQMKGLD